MTTPSNVLTDEDVALLRSLPSIGSTGAMADRFTRDQVRKLMADQYVIGEDYLIWRSYIWRSYHADILIETLDHHTQQARADERRRIDESAKKLYDAYGNVEAYWLTENDVWSVEGEYAPTFTAALFNATKQDAQ